MERLLLIGATGAFGRRLAENLAGIDGLELILASRLVHRAQSLAAALAGGSADIRAVELDHRRDLEAALHRLRPWTVIDASGPFQGAGYRIPLAAIEAGAHVIDLADARDYLAGYVASLDGPARAAGVAALAGASSTPTLSAAVLRDLTAGWQRLDAVRMAITPAGGSDVGRSAVAAILSYAGRPVPVWREGALQTTLAWCRGRPLDMPGLGRRRVAPVETYDAEFLGAGFAVASRVEFEAGLESAIEQRGLECVASLRRGGWIGDLEALAPLLLAVRRLTRLTTGDNGGMLVQATGLDRDGRLCVARWSLLARNDDGPHVPTLPAVAAVRALLKGSLEPGARIAADALSLADIEVELAPHAITTQTEVGTIQCCVFETALGEETMDRLPPALQTFHGLAGAPVWSGTAEIETGGGWPGRLLRRVMGMPEAGSAIPVTVTVDRPSGSGNGEIWTRNFAGQRFSSHLQLQRPGQVSETFGPLSFDLGLAAVDGGLEMPVTGWRCFGIPMPRFLRPLSQAREFEDDRGRFCFDVRLSLPVFGMLIHYRGWLVPAAKAVTSDHVQLTEAGETNG